MNKVSWKFTLKAEVRVNSPRSILDDCGLGTYSSIAKGWEAIHKSLTRAREIFFRKKLDSPHLKVYVSFLKRKIKVLNTEQKRFRLYFKRVTEPWTLNQNIKFTIIWWNQYLHIIIMLKLLFSLLQKIGKNDFKSE